tara:strand:+ start:323 stop:1084 length:762 start_codon:yes stop_codon:yes gene_type:complete
MKLTKRKAFNFLRSYFDVLNELKEDSDKLDFLMSIINKQFLDEDPKDLGFIAKLCYESQRHQIEKSVNGWLVANKTDLQGNTTPPHTPPKGAPLPLPPKEEQEQVQEQVQEEEKVKKEVIESLYSLYPTKCHVNNNSTGKSKTNKDKIKTLLKTTTEEHLKYTINRYKDECIKDKRYMKNFGTFLNNLPDYEKEVDPHALDEKYIYYQWMNDPSIMARRVLKTEAEKMFEGQACGGYTPKFLKSIKNKKPTWN